MKAHKTDIPDNSLIRRYLPADYADSFACEVTAAEKLSAEDIMINFWTVMPGWVNSLFWLRNLLVRPFGLDTGKDTSLSGKLEEMIRSGNGSSGLMSAAARSGNETVMLLSDKHLDAYISVHTGEKDGLQTVTVITLVNYHNKLGRIYFFFIRLFHAVIVKSMLTNTLKRMIK